MPADRTKVDDGAATRTPHSRNNRLRREELVSQVHRNAVVPIFGGNIVNAVAVVIGSVVDQNVDCALFPFNISNRLPDRVDVAQVAVAVQGRVRHVAAQPFDKIV